MQLSHMPHMPSAFSLECVGSRTSTSLAKPATRDPRVYAECACTSRISIRARQYARWRWPHAEWNSSPSLDA